jgi:hypothetical protein
MKTPQRSLFYRTRQERQRGSALVIALMVILALTGLGIVGMKHASQEMTSSSNRRNRSQAAEVATSGLRIGVQRFADTGFSTHEYLQRWHNVRRAKFGRDVPYQGYTLAHSTDYTDDHQVYGSREELHRSFEAQQGTHAAFSATIQNKPKTSLRRPRGEELNGGKCFWSYDLHADGTVGEVVVGHDIRIGVIQAGATSRGGASGLLGPVGCPDVAGN